MLEFISSPEGPSSLAAVLLQCPLTDEELAQPRAPVPNWPTKGRLLRELAKPGHYEVLGLLWHFHSVTTEQLTMLVGCDVQDQLDRLRALGLVTSTHHRSMTVNQLCDDESLSRLSKILGPTIRLGLTGSRAPLRSAWGHVRHDLLVVETVLWLLSLRGPFRYSELGGEKAAGRHLRGVGSGGRHPMGRRTPQADALVYADSGHPRFVEVTASARRHQIRHKMRRWVNALDPTVRGAGAEVVFLNACGPAECDNARRLHGELLREALQTPPTSGTRTPGDTHAIVRSVHLIDARAAWRKTGADEAQELPTVDI